jgi:hypothetical protein
LASVGGTGGSSWSSDLITKASTLYLAHHHYLHPPPAPSPFPTNTTSAITMADSMEGVVTEGEQPKTENVEQKAIAGT